ncbi:DUF29 domain-containing protein [Nostoc sp.]|uniref:DUF29 domain-containing protein n=1 Tax=Nostoc sp. TaxID=1180 RepID=UPI002FF8F2D8
MNRSTKLKSDLLQLLKHLLLYQHWSLSECKNHWKAEIDNFQVELRKLTKSKNLYNYLLTVLEEIYIEALRQAKRKSGLNSFPQTCPYSIEQTLDVDYLPPFEF